MDDGHHKGRDTPFAMAAIISDIKSDSKGSNGIALFATPPGERDRTGRYAGKLSWLNRAPPKSLGGREEVSLSTRAIVAHSVPQPCLRKAVGAPLAAVFTSWLPTSWRRFSLAPARDMYLFCRLFNCQGTSIQYPKTGTEIAGVFALTAQGQLRSFRVWGWRMKPRGKIIQDGEQNHPLILCHSCEKCAETYHLCCVQGIRFCACVTDQAHAAVIPSALDLDVEAHSKYINIFVDCLL